MRIWIDQDGYFVGKFKLKTDTSSYGIDRKADIEGACFVRGLKCEIEKKGCDSGYSRDPVYLLVKATGKYRVDIIWLAKWFKSQFKSV